MKKSPNKFIFLLTIGLLTLTFFSVSNAQTIYYVNANATGEDNGTSWSDGFLNLQPALNAANPNDEIWVAQGIYVPTVEVAGTGPRFRAFQLIDGVSIYGGFEGLTGTEGDFSVRDFESFLTILSGDINGDDTPGDLITNRDDNVYSIIHHPIGYGVSNTAVLDGFTIRGGHADGTSVGSTNRGGGVYIVSNSSSTDTPTFRNIIFEDNFASDTGGAVRFTNTVNSDNSFQFFEDVVFRNNSAGSGGAIYAGNADVRVLNSAFLNNSSTSFGGAIRLNAGTGTPVLELDSVTLSNNTSDNGGAITTLNGQAKLSNILFINNSSSNNGGGLFLNGTSFDVSSGLGLEDLVFENNSANNDGGAIYFINIPPITELRNARFESNSANRGGAIAALSDADFNIIDANFLNNTSTDNGGAVYIFNANVVSIFNSQLEDNESGGDGGGIFVQNTDFSLNNSTLVSNSSNTTDGGGAGLYLTNVDNFQITNSTFQNNNALERGGGIFITNSDGGFINGLISQGNELSGSGTNNRGAGLYVNSSTFTMVNGLITGNKSNGNGAGIRFDSLNDGQIVRIINSTISGNYTDGNGGGILNFSDSGSTNGIVEITNAIVWGNVANANSSTSDLLSNGSFSQIDVINSFYENSANFSSGVTNITNSSTDDPLFFDFTTPTSANTPNNSGDYRLTATSPAIEFGLNTPFGSGGSADGVNEDLRGNDRIISGTIDAGAYEYSNLLDGIIYVDVTASGANDGSDWANAFTNLQNAIDAASGTSIIVVAGGDYTNTSSPAPVGNTIFNIDSSKDGIQIYGGYAGGETLSLSDLQLSSRDFNTNETTLLDTSNSSRILTLNDLSNVIIDGFTVKDGRAEVPLPDRSLGGGLLCITNDDSCSPTLRNLVFDNNQAEIGGAVFIGAFGTGVINPIFENVNFRNNTAFAIPDPDDDDETEGRGAGLGIYALNSITGLVKLTDVVFENNTSEAEDGAAGSMILFGEGSGTNIEANLTNIEFSNNIANGTDGVLAGLVAFTENDAELHIALTNGLFNDNSASSFGGAFGVAAGNDGIVNASLVNTTIANNSITQEDGNAIIAVDLFTLEGDGTPGTVNLDIINSIVYGNTTGPTEELSSIEAIGSTVTVNVQHALIEGSGGSSGWSLTDITDIGNNIDRNPLFIDPSLSDYQVTDISPVLNAGTTTPFDIGGVSEGVTTDIRGIDRLTAGEVDMGAYQFNGDVGGIIYVDLNASGAANGISWNNAFTSLEVAIEAIPEGPRTIVVAGGTYIADSPSSSPFVLSETAYIIPEIKDGFKIYGGYAGNEVLSLGNLLLDSRDFTANETILDGNNDHRLFGMVDVTQETVIDGFTIQNGLHEEADPTSGVRGGGAGIYCSGSSNCSPGLNNLKLQNNRAEVGSGLLIFANNADVSPTITNSHFISNTAFSVLVGGEDEGNGSGIFIRSDNNGTGTITIDNVEFSDNINESQDGGAASTTTFFTQSGSELNVEMSNIVFTNNTSQNDGTVTGALFLAQGGDINFNIINGLFDQNSGSEFISVLGFGAFGATLQGQIINSTFAGNTLRESGAVIGVANFNDTGNPALDGIVNVEILNSIIFNNTQDEDAVPLISNLLVLGSNTSISVSNSLIEGSGGSNDWSLVDITDGGNNIDENPLFRNFATGDYRLGSYSPAIDGGTQLPFEAGEPAENIESDLDGNPRFYGQIDMGPYESGAAVKITGPDPYTGKFDSWRTIASPGQNQTFRELFSPYWTQGIDGASINFGDRNIFLWNSNEVGYESPSTMNEEIDNFRGIFFYLFDDQNYDGIPNGFPKPLSTIFEENNPIVDIPLFSKGDTNPTDPAYVFERWNLIGNPWALPIVAEDFLSALAVFEPSVNMNLYVWDAVNGVLDTDYPSGFTDGLGNELSDFGLYRLFNSSTDFVSPFQSFWVYFDDEFTTTDNRRDVSVNKDDVTTDDINASTLLDISSVEIPIAIIGSNGTTGKFSLVLDDRIESTEITRYNAFILTPPTEKYTLLYNVNDGGNFARTHIPESFEGRIEMALAISTTDKSGEFRLGWKDLPAEFNHLEFILIDNLTNDTYNLNEAGFFSFYIEPSQLLSKTIKDDKNLLIEKAKEVNIPPLPMPGITHSSSPISLLSDDSHRFVLIIDSEADESKPELPEFVELSQNYPNPFNPATTINYALPDNDIIRLDVYNVLGQRVATLFNGEQNAGRHTVNFDASRLASGVYIYRLNTSSKVITRKMTLIK